MTNYPSKSYGRNEEIQRIFSLFEAGKDISQHGPRRLGKTFVLDRMVEQANKNGFVCLKLEIAGCTEPKQVFRRLCEVIDTHRGVTRRLLTTFQQRINQLISPNSEQAGPWYQSLLGLDWEDYLDRLLSTLQDDQEYKWALLIDELPIFLKAMHDKGGAGIAEARNFMNLFSQLRSKYPKIRWLITGSIGIDPLAREGQYTGVLAKFHQLQLLPLSEEQAIDFLKDTAANGSILNRQNHKEITTAEAQAIVEAVGWRAAYYLEAFAQCLPETPEIDDIKVKRNIDFALEQMLLPHNRSSLNAWEEHIRKHHSVEERKLSFDILNLISQYHQGLTIDAIIKNLKIAESSHDFIYHHLIRLIDEGFIFQEPFGDATAPYRFKIAIIRLWWLRYKPKA